MEGAAAQILVWRAKSELWDRSISEVGYSYQVTNRFLMFVEAECLKGTDTSLHMSTTTAQIAVQ